MALKLVGSGSLKVGICLGVEWKQLETDSLKVLMVID